MQLACSVATAAAPARRHVVLVVDDDATVRTVHARLLEKQGFAVVSASNGREVLARVADPTLAIDAVVADIMMPDMDGLELIRTLRQERPGLAIVTVSGGGDIVQMDFSAAARALGAAATLSKPCSGTVLAETLRDVLAARQPG